MRFFLLLLFLFSYGLLKAQNSPRSSYAVTTRMHYGFIWNFSEEVSHLANQHLAAFELNITRQTKGNKPWQREYRCPQVGYSLYYYTFDPNKPVGNAAALLIHAGKNIYHTRRSNLQWRMGFGTAYVEKRYQLVSNFKNNLISQRLNFTISGQANFNVRITPRLIFNLGIGLLHISNGALKRPNFGINLPTIHAGIGIHFAKGEETCKRDSLPLFKRKTSIQLSPFMGFKEVYPVNGPRYFLGGLNALVERRVNRKSGLHAGLDFSYDHSKKSEIAYDTIPVDNVFLNRAQAGIIVGHELYINHVSLLTQVGGYFYDPTHINKRLYQKVGLKYYFSEKLFVNMTMKIHLGVADWIEWGIGVRL